MALADQRKVAKALTAAREAGLSEEEINQTLAYGYDVRISNDNAIELLGILTDAKQQGFSIDPLLEKIDEGLAKRVSFEIIKAVLRKKIRDYQFILDLYKNNNPGGEVVLTTIQRAADGIDLGLEYQELESLFNGIRDVPVEMYEVAAVNLAFLKQLNFKSDLSKRMLRAGLEHNCLGPGWIDFFKIVEAGKKKGISEDEIAQTAIKIFEQNQGINDFARALGLGKTKIKKQ